MRTTVSVLAVLFASFCPPLDAQVLTTAETLGRGKQAVLVSENRIFVDDARLHLIVGQYVRGLSDRFDLYLVGGATRTDDETGTSVITQFWLGAAGTGTSPNGRDSACLFSGSFQPRSRGVIKRRTCWRIPP
jgi:hypothetical protein